MFFLKILYLLLIPTYWDADMFWKIPKTNMNSHTVSKVVPINHFQ